MPTNLYVDPGDALASGVIRFRDIPVCRYSLTAEHEKQIYSKREFLRLYRDMMIIREFETMLSELKAGNDYHGVRYLLSGPVHLAIGEEAVAVGEAYCMKPEDLLFGTHRNHASAIAKGLSAIEKMTDQELINMMKTYLDGDILTPVAENAESNIGVRELAVQYFLYGELCEIFGKRTGFNRGLGGSTHAHFTPFGIYPNNAVPAGSVGFAVGAALYKKIQNEKGFVVANLGDGALGSGAVWEAMNMACMDQIREIWNKNGGLSLLFAVINNHYAMDDQPLGETMGWKKAARIGAGIAPNQMHAERVDGTDPMAVIDAIERKKELLEREDGPIFLEFVTYRECPHHVGRPLDERLEEEMEAWRAHDPVECYRNKLLQNDIAAEKELFEIDQRIVRSLTMLAKMAADMEISPRITPEELETLVFADLAPNSNAEPIHTEVTLSRAQCSRSLEIAKKNRFAFDENGEPFEKETCFNIKDAVFEPIFSRFYEDPSFIVYGESLRSGGIHGVFDNMSEAIPFHRFFNVPLSESAIVSSAIGYAMCGGHVAIEIMYADLLARAGEEIFGQLAKWRSMSGGTLKLPILIRVPIGKSAGAQLSGDLSSMMASVPGLKVIYPATPYDMKGMLASALSSGDPVISFEHEKLYPVGECFRAEGVPAEAYFLPIGRADIKEAGTDITILTIGASLYPALEAASVLSEQGISAEVIDARSLVPFDYDTVCRSVAKTGKLIVVGEGTERASIMRDIASNVTELMFDKLDAPPVALGSRNLPVPAFMQTTSHAAQVDMILDAIHQKILPLADYTSKNDLSPMETIRRAQKGI